ncbi:hypothetical protein [Rummeliibacillus pycnus]|uniref:hypothetical protein n=1 Tax=Rummeliibacillus pycnus TaxID=101070 RepID=UPI000C9A23D5|nr:hypothetical protein [Rummeliibacillus pycnus]
MKKITKIIITTLITTSIIFGMHNTTPVSADSLSLTQDQKESYYKQYTTIVKEVNLEYPEVELKLDPFENFKAEEWVKPEEFKRIVIDMANLKFVPTPNNNSISANTIKKVTTTINGTAVTISINGSFQTILNEAASRQAFGNVLSLSTSSDKGIWIQTGFTPFLIDLGRTYSIDLGGTFTYNGVTLSRGINIEFYCNPNGAIN